MFQIYVAFQFGLITVTLVYLASKGGSFLDLKFETYPFFTVVLILISVFYSFFSLINKLNMIEKFKNKRED